MLMLPEYLLCGRHSFKRFTYISSFNSYNNSFKADTHYAHLKDDETKIQRG